MGKRKRVLVIGSGGREHALARRLLESESVGHVVVTPGNPGTERAPESLLALGKQLNNVQGDPLRTAPELALREAFDLAVVGPEAPLCAGLADELVRCGVPTFGPSGAAARLEGSKAFMKEFAVRHGIRTARHVVVKNLADLPAALGEFSEPPVVKADGLCGGKGVVVPTDFDEAANAARSMLSGQRFGTAGATLVLEERLTGFETSVHAVSDGERFVLLPCAQDHKRLGTGDTGPNTGGMGTFAPTPRVGAQLLESIREGFVARAIAGMAEDGCPFRGALFAGLMISTAGEPVLLEYNVRFGDPETQVLMGRIDGDFAELLEAAALGRLSSSAPVLRPGASVCVVLAAHGYPGTPRNGDEITGIENAEATSGVRVYHAGTALERGRLMTAGGRVLGVTAEGATFDHARRVAYEAVGQIHFDGMQYREDIGATSPSDFQGA